MASHPDLRRSQTASLAGIALATLSILTAPSRPARAEYTFEVVKSFELPDAFASDLTLGLDGAFYGTTREGGAANRGTIFRVETDGTFERLHSFDGNDGQGGSRLVVGGDGALHGTSRGGSFGRGVLFRVDNDGNFAVVHSFSGPDGADPASMEVDTGAGDRAGVRSSGSTARGW